MCGHQLFHKQPHGEKVIILSEAWFTAWTKKKSFLMMHCILSIISSLVLQSSQLPSFFLSFFLSLLFLMFIYF